MLQFTVNGEKIQTDVAPDTPVLWFLRDQLGKTGTKYSCGMGLCGACTVHLNNEPIRSCSTPISAVAGKRIETIEEIERLPAGRAVQAAWIAEDVVQCGYCQSGQVMAATALLLKNKNPSDAQIDAAMSGNICRCGTYNRVRKAIKVAAVNLAKPTKPNDAMRVPATPKAAAKAKA